MRRLGFKFMTTDLLTHTHAGSHACNHTQTRTHTHTHTHTQTHTQQHRHIHYLVYDTQVKDAWMDSMIVKLFEIIDEHFC